MGPYLSLTLCTAKALLFFFKLFQGLDAAVDNPLDIVPEMYRSQVENTFDGTIEKVTCNEDVLFIDIGAMVLLSWGLHGIVRKDILQKTKDPN